jgi:hypothetical protein
MKNSIGSLAAAAIFTLIGCGQGDVVSTETTGASQSEELTVSQQQLLGSWKATDGSLMAIVLSTSNGQKVFTGQQFVLCFSGPCNPLHLEGTWSVSGNKLTLKETDNTLAYTFDVSNGTLALSESATSGTVGHLAKVGTWCGKSSDCSLQSYIHPACAPAADVCQADQTCGTVCGSPRATAGFGDVCGPSIGVQCGAGMTCGNLPPGVGGTGTCMPTK